MKAWMISAILPVAAVFAAGSCPPAGAAGEPEPTPEQIEELKREITVLLLLRELDLDKAKAAELLELSRRAAELRRTHEEKLAALNVEFEKACREFRDEDLANKGFTPELEHRTFMLEQAILKVRKAFFGAVNALEEEAARVFTEKQLAVFERFPARDDLSGLARLARGGPLVRPLPLPLRKELQRVRAVPAAKWRVRRDAIAREWTERFEKSNRIEWTDAEREGHVEKVLSLLEKVRSLSEERFSESGLEILEALRSENEERELGRQLEGIHKAEYGNLGRLGLFISAPCTPGILEKRFGLGPAKTEAGREGTEEKQGKNGPEGRK